MAYRIESIELFVRDMPPGRMAFVLGKDKTGADNKPSQKRRVRGIYLCRMVVSDDKGRSAWGASGDRPSFGWLDKRKKYSNEDKYTRLQKLVEAASKVYLANPKFKTPFGQWHRCHAKIQKLGRERDHENLSASFASALFERAMIDAIHEGALTDVPTIEDPTFGLSVPTSCPNIPNEILVPSKTWSDQQAYRSTAKHLAALFEENFTKYADVASTEIAEAGPRATKRTH